jgi:hypothetical protein
MTISTLTKKDYNFVLKLDKKVYPTKNSVTKKIISSWYKNNPEFGIKISGKRKGICVVIPLNESGWTKLINGKLSESNVTGKYLFDNKREKEIGIHIYHIEKFEKNKNFYILALKQINKIIKKLRISNPKLKICGLSGLCVSSSGIDLFYKKFNCRERDYIHTEHILEKKGKLICIDETKENLNSKLKSGYLYKNKCTMLILYPNEPSIVWNHIKKEK